MDHTLTDDPATLFERASAGDAQACYELGRRFAAEQSFSRARRWLRDAAGRGHAGASTELGLMELFGIGLPADTTSGVALLLDAERAGSAQAQYHLALLGWCGTLVPFDLDAMAQRLRCAAEAGFAPALRAAALVYARMPGAGAASQACLERAAAAGDATSRRLLELRLSRPNATQPMSGALPPLELTTPLPENRVRRSEQPHVETIDDVFSPEECELVVSLGQAFLAPSIMYDQDANRWVRKAHRTSSEMAFHGTREDFALRWLQWRQLRLLGDVPMTHAEYLTLVRYGVGEEYRPHRDYLAWDPKIFAPTGPGQRVNTVFCYLNDVPEGGETEFPILGITIVPKLGRVVLFRNVTETGQIDEATLHAGLPVRSGEKWLATLWTHERRFRAF